MSRSASNWSHASADGKLQLHPPNQMTLRLTLHKDENGAFESLFEATLSVS